MEPKKGKTFFYNNRYPHPDNLNFDLQHVYTEVHYNARYQSAVGVDYKDRVVSILNTAVRSVNQCKINRRKLYHKTFSSTLRKQNSIKVLKG